MTEFKETELDERASRWPRSCRPTRLSVRDTATRVPPSPWRYRLHPVSAFHQA